MKIRRWGCVLCAVFLLCSVFAISALTGTEERGEEVSFALNILAGREQMAKAVVFSNEISFCEEDFAKALNVSSVSSVTIETLPSRSDGILYLGGAEVYEGQTISNSNIRYLKFVFTNREVTDTTFYFTTNHGAYSVECSLYYLEYENRAPMVSAISEAVLSVDTYRDICVFGRMESQDPDGDDLYYEVISYPSNGILKVTDRCAGEYIYYPTADYTGADSFRYVAIDRYGNYSSAVTVSLNVENSQTSLVYSDLLDHQAHVAAVFLTERGIMASTELDGNYYFYPEKSVTRAEFLVMAMKAAGIAADSKSGKTVFKDDEDISPLHRGYIDVAQRMGYVCGKLNDDGDLVFCPNDPITRYEAAVMLQNIAALDLPVIKQYFADGSSVPVWARDAVAAMTYAGIMSGTDGYFAPTATVSRAQAAEMLYLWSAYSD